MLAALILLPGCWTPRTTGPTTMVGAVLDETGSPVAGMTIESTEASTVTSPEGWFGLSYKDPTQFVWFTYDGVLFERHYQAGVDVDEVRLQLPPLAARAFSCEMDTTCEVRVAWDLGDGLKAIARGTCDPDDRVVRLTAPASGLPAAATCRPDPGRPDEPLVATDAGTHVRLTPPPVELTLRLVATGSTPASCDVFVDGARAEPLGDGRYRATVFGVVQIDAQCDGRYTTPQMLIVRKPIEVNLQWHDRTPVLDVREYSRGGTVARLKRVRGTNRGWSLELPAEADGTFHLPQLPEGDYLVTVGVPAESVQNLDAVDTIEAGVLQMVELPYPPSDGASVAVAGVFRAPRTVVAGVLPVVLTEDVERLPASIATP